MTNASATPKLLGVIKNITARWHMLDIFVYDDALLIARGSLAGAALRGAGAWPAADATERRRLATEAADRRNGLQAAHSTNRLIRYDTLASAKLTKHLPGSRLTLTFPDGTAEKFEWKRTYDNHTAVTTVLRAALGPKLETP